MRKQVKVPNKNQKKDKTIEENKEVKIEVEKNEKKKEDLNKKQEEKILELEKKLEEMSNKYLYTLAEMKDLHKIYEKENKTSIKYVTYDFMYELLQIMDVFSIVLENHNIPKEVAAYFKGFELVFEKLKVFFQDHDVKEIITNVGEKFNHNDHNAVETVETEQEELDDTIESILLKGYRILDRILRPVSVKVYKYVAKKEETVIDESEKGE